MGQDQNLRYKIQCRLYSNNSGQAAVEYILLLVIIVSLALGAKKAFSNLNDFMTSYIGDYVSCLMEYGELPSMGISEADLKKHTEDGKKCDTEFASFTFENGRPPNSSSSGSGGVKSASGSSSGEKSKGSRSGSRGGDSDSGSGIDGRKKKSPYTVGSTAGASKGYGSADGGSAKSKTFVIEDEDEDAKRRANRQNNRRSTTYYGGAEKYKVITGKLEEEINKSSPTRIRGPTTRTVATNEEGDRFKPYKKVFVPPEPKKPAEVRDDGEGFSFGYLFKWLLIAGMVIAIVILMGSQIMNYNNSGE